MYTRTTKNQILTFCPVLFQITLAFKFTMTNRRYPTIPCEIAAHILSYLGVPPEASTSIFADNPNAIIAEAQRLRDVHLYCSSASHSKYTLPQRLKMTVPATFYAATDCNILEANLATFVAFKNTTAAVALGLLACHRHQDYTTGIKLFWLAKEQGCPHSPYMLAVLYATNEKYRKHSHAIFDCLNRDGHVMGKLHCGNRDAVFLNRGIKYLKRFEWLRSFLPPPNKTLNHGGTARPSFECNNKHCINRFYFPDRDADRTMKHKQHAPHWLSIVTLITPVLPAKNRFTVPKAVYCFSCNSCYYCCSACRTMDWIYHKSKCGVGLERID